MIVDWKDDRGRWFRMSVPDDSEPEQWGYGSPLGPPDLSELGLPEPLMVRLHNLLFDRGILTALDAKARRHDIIGAWQHALAVDVQAVVDSYGKAEQAVVIRIEHPVDLGPDDSQKLVAQAARRGRR